MQTSRIIAHGVAVLILTFGVTASGQGVQLTPRDQYEQIATRSTDQLELREPSANTVPIAPPPSASAANNTTLRSLEVRPPMMMESMAPGIDPRWGEQDDIQLPRTMDLRPYLPKPGDQGKTNSCVAWAIAYATYSCQVCQQRRRSPTYDSDVFNPNFLYDQLQKDGQGLLAIDAINYVKTHGCASKATSDNAEAAATEASTFRAARNARAVNLKDIKTYLYEGYPVILLVELDDKFKSKTETGTFVWSGNRSGDYHAVTAVGYDDDKQAVLIMNSWGSDWKDGGYCWSSYRNFRGINDQNWCAEAHVVGIKRPAPYTASIILGRNRRGRIDERVFRLKADRKIYEDDQVISPVSWNIDGIACSKDSLFALARDQTIYLMNDVPERSWTHLSRGNIQNHKVTMMAANESIPLHVLTDNGVVFRYDRNSGQWLDVSLPANDVAKVVDLRMDKNGVELRATTANGRVFANEGSSWALAP